jgi:hypothetical protein
MKFQLISTIPDFQNISIRIRKFVPIAILIQSTDFGIIKEFKPESTNRQSLKSRNCESSSHVTDSDSAKNMIWRTDRGIESSLTAV